MKKYQKNLYANSDLSVAGSQRKAANARIVASMMNRDNPAWRELPEELALGTARQICFVYGQE